MKNGKPKGLQAERSAMKQKECQKERPRLKTYDLWARLYSGLDVIEDNDIEEAQKLIDQLKALVKAKDKIYQNTCPSHPNGCPVRISTRYLSKNETYDTKPSEYPDTVYTVSLGFKKPKYGFKENGVHFMTIRYEKESCVIGRKNEFRT